MRWLIFLSAVTLAACGPNRGHKPPRADSLETVDLPSKEYIYHISPALPQGDTDFYTANMRARGWKLVKSQPSFPGSTRLVTPVRSRAYLRLSRPCMAELSAEMASGT